MKRLVLAINSFPHRRFLRAFERVPVITLISKIIQENREE